MSDLDLDRIEKYVDVALSTIQPESHWSDTKELIAEVRRLRDLLEDSISMENHEECCKEAVRQAKACTFGPKMHEDLESAIEALEIISRIQTNGEHIPHAGIAEQALAKIRGEGKQ